MPARDVIHSVVKKALIKDGWTITADPFFLRYEDAPLYADLAAERTLAAERGNQKIAVENKSFLGPSPLHELEEAVGQFLIYKSVLEITEPDRRIYLGISDLVHKSLFERKIAQMLVERLQLSLVVVRISAEEVQQWIN